MPSLTYPCMQPSNTPLVAFALLDISCKCIKGLGSFTPSALEESVENFIYTGKCDFMTTKDVLSETCELPSYPFQPNQSPASKEDSDAAAYEQTDEGRTIRRIRKGIYKHLAKGAPKAFCNNQVSDVLSDSESDGPPIGMIRRFAARYEASLYNKFDVTLGDLLLSPSRITSWMMAAKCLQLKASFIRDRICFQESVNSLFKGEKFLMLSTADTFFASDAADLHSTSSHVSSDFEAFVKHPWSNFSGLQKAKVDVSSSDGKEIDHVHNMKALDDAERAKNYPGWQDKWAYLYISALNVMQRRCLNISLALLLEKQSNATDADIAPKDVALLCKVYEELGTLAYMELQSSLKLGFQTRKMTRSEKRALAQKAFDFYRLAADSLQFALENGTLEEDGLDTQDWHLHMMLGKCCEKLASTYPLSSVPYKDHMLRALALYNKSYAAGAAREGPGYSKEKRGDEFGGCSHGSIEVFYRLHACRFKCILRALRSEDKKNAIENTLEMVELYQFEDTFEPLASFESDADALSGRLFSFVKDIASAFCYCRSKTNNYFHRSVYRHAQLLLFSPAIVQHELAWPKTPIEIISLPQLSQEQKGQVQGYVLGCTHFASAADCLAVLFNKKQDQLVNVWLTTPSVLSPFETINQSSSKFDYTRTKYAGAYMSCLRLTPRMETVRQLLVRANGASRDYPGYFFLSAVNKGNDCVTQSVRDPGMPCSGRGFLWGFKKHLHESISQMIVDRKAIKIGLGFSLVDQELTKTSRIDLVKHYLGLAYDSFLYKKGGFPASTMTGAEELVPSVEIDAIVSTGREIRRIQEGSDLSCDNQDVYAGKGLGLGLSQEELHTFLCQALVFCNKTWPEKALWYQKVPRARPKGGKFAGSANKLKRSKPSSEAAQGDAQTSNANASQSTEKKRMPPKDAPSSGPSVLQNLPQPEQSKKPSEPSNPKKKRKVKEPTEDIKEQSEKKMAVVTITIPEGKNPGDELSFVYKGVRKAFIVPGNLKDNRKVKISLKLK